MLAGHVARNTQHGDLLLPFVEETRSLRRVGHPYEKQNADKRGKRAKDDEDELPSRDGERARLLAV